MKLSLFAILLFAVILSLCGSAPSTQKFMYLSVIMLFGEDIEYSAEDKTASGNLKRPKIVSSVYTQPDTDESGIFWISQKEYHSNIEEKCQLFEPETAEKQFIGYLLECIDMNFGMFQFLYQSIKKLSMCENYLHNTRPGTSFSKDTKLIDTIAACKDSLRNNFIKLLDNLLPAYKRNEDLLKLVQKMNHETGIKSDLLPIIAKAHNKMENIWNSFWGIFHQTPVKGFMQGLSEMQKKEKLFDQGLQRVKENDKKLLEALNLARNINFTILINATNELCLHATLAIDGASSSK